MILPNPSVGVGVTKVRQRQEAYGRVVSKSLKAVALKFGGAPIWILGLHPIRVENLYIPDFASFSELSQYVDDCGVEPSIFNRMVSLLGRKRFCFGSSGGEATVWLVSGNIQFLNEQFYALRTKNCIFVTDTHKIWRRLPTSPLSLCRLTHSQCGGGTTYSVLYGTTYPHQLQSTPLERSVGDFIDHSVYVPEIVKLPERFISSDVLYTISDKPILVHYLTRRVPKGWVCRELTPTERGKIYDFDMDLCHSKVKGLVPRSILTTLLTMLKLTPDTSGQLQELQPMSLPRVDHEEDITWLSTLNQALPHSWRASAETTSTSAKHDDASVQTSIWDLRISPLFPSFTSAILKLMRAAVVRYCKRKLYKSFVRYLRSVHPSSWTSYVAARSYNTRGGKRRKLTSGSTQRTKKQRS